jgi:hypothetical protein
VEAEFLSPIDMDRLHNCAQVEQENANAEWVSRRGQVWGVPLVVVSTGLIYDSEAMERPDSLAAMFDEANAGMTTYQIQDFFPLVMNYLGFDGTARSYAHDPEIARRAVDDHRLSVEEARRAVDNHLRRSAQIHERAQAVRRRPKLTVWTSYLDQRIPLARFGTTIGGWRSESVDGTVMWKYKNSPVGPRVWHQIVAAPVWLPPQSTPAGDLLDHVLDRYADIVIIAGLAGGVGRYALGLAAVTGVLMTSYLGTQAQAVGLDRVYGGLVGRADRLVIVVVVTAVAAVVPGPVVWLTLVGWLLVFFALVGHLTAIQRFYHAYGALD